MTKADMYARLKQLGITLSSSKLRKTTAKELQAMLNAKHAEIKRVKAARTARGLPRSSANVVPALDASRVRKPSKGVNFPVRDASHLRAARAGSKQAALIDAIARPEGAAFDDLVRVTGWRDGSTAKSGLYWDVRQKGYGVRTAISDDGTQRYHLVLPKGVVAPLGHVEPAPVKTAAHRG
jgi:hypothetical protein